MTRKIKSTKRRATARTKLPRKVADGKPKPKLVLVQALPADVAKLPASPKEKVYVRAEDLTVEGATSPEGVPYIRTFERNGGNEAWATLDDYSDDARAARVKLRNAGIYLFGEALKVCIEKSRKVEEFPPKPLLEHPGWTGPHFALPSGDVFSPAGEIEQVVLFETRPDKCTRKGRLKDWKEGVARLAAGQHIITSMLMLAFAGPLLCLSRIRFNFGFELVGRKGSGKSTVQQLVASVIGGGVEPMGGNFWISANTTTNGLEESMAELADLLMVIEEMSLFCASETEKRRASKLVDLVFRLADGTTKSRYQSGKQMRVRFPYLTSSNEPLSQILGDSQTSEAAADRLMTIPIMPEAKHGVFTKLPKGCENGDEAARAISSLITDHHGLAMRRFLKCLVQERSTNEAELIKRIERDIDKFRAAVGVDGNIGSEARVADAFGLVYAAGRMAKRFGALPQGLRCLRAAKECHRLNRSVSGPPPAPLEVLRRVMKQKEVIVIDPANLQKISDKRMKAAPAIFRRFAKDRIEVLLSKEALKRIPGWKAMLKDPEMRGIMVSDSDKPTVKRTIRNNKKQERFYCFVLPPDDDE